MVPRNREAVTEIDTWQVVIVSDPENPLPRNAQILRLIDPERRTEYILGQPVVLVGRLPTADLLVDWSEVGRLHCRLEWRRGRWRATELESGVGFFVNGTRYRESELRPGDFFTIAERTFDVDQIAVRELV